MYEEALRELEEQFGDPAAVALTDTERLTHLQSCLTGEAREAVRGLLCEGDV